MFANETVRGKCKVKTNSLLNKHLIHGFKTLRRFLYVILQRETIPFWWTKNQPKRKQLTSHILYTYRIYWRRYINVSVSNTTASVSLCMRFHSPILICSFSRSRSWFGSVHSRNLDALIQLCSVNSREQRVSFSVFIQKRERHRLCHVCIHLYMSLNVCCNAVRWFIWRSWAQTINWTREWLCDSEARMNQDCKQSSGFCTSCSEVGESALPKWKEKEWKVAISSGSCEPCTSLHGVHLFGADHMNNAFKHRKIAMVEWTQHAHARTSHRSIVTYQLRA